LAYYEVLELTTRYFEITKIHISIYVVFHSLVFLLFLWIMEVEGAEDVNPVLDIFFVKKA